MDFLCPAGVVSFLSGGLTGPPGSLSGVQPPAASSGHDWTTGYSRGKRVEQLGGQQK